MSAATTREHVPQILREIFDRNLPEIRVRLAMLEELLNQFFNGHEEFLSDCIKAAHDLTGSLGVFGLSTPSENASCIETMLRSAQPGDKMEQQQLLRLISELHESVKA